MDSSKEKIKENESNTKIIEKREFKDDVTKDWFFFGKIALPLLPLAIAAFYIWGDWLIHGNVGCFVFTRFHIYCPGCGGTRAFYYMVHGHLLKSIIMNPFVPYTTIVYIFFMINTILCKFTKKAGFAGFPVTNMVYVGLGILFAQWIIRNILFVFFHLTVL